MRAIELLSPAKNLECGLAAINHGADAVYIGASQFSARAAAGNSIADIEELCKYAHKFRAKVLVTFNTLLTDNQLSEAEKLVQEGICCIRRGLCDLCEAIRCLVRNNSCEAQQAVRAAICIIEEGLAAIIEGLCLLDLGDCETDKMIKCAICGIEDGLKAICGGLECIINCNKCEGLKAIQAGICDIEVGLCELIKAIRC